MANTGFIVVGTAGHIDHGKTALVTALTGKNTDRLKEERERGISIDIDFAPLHLANGTIVGMVDVPGHERFVRNMVAGAAGIDAALLVIDVREGMMPQTYEHIAILELLGVQSGMIALTKADLVDDEWIDMAQTVIRDELAGTMFENAPMIVTSVKTGQGLNDLADAISSLAKRIRTRDVNGAFRLPVDKVFSIPGFGTIVSGTVWRGKAAVGDVLDRLPHRQPVRIRGIQVHGKPVSFVRAGQRAALNLTGLNKSDIHRGSVIAVTGTLHESRLLDVRIQLLSREKRALKHRSRVHVHLGTAEVVGRVLLLEANELGPGNTGFAQLLLDVPIVAQVGDRFVLRGQSPITTIGGGYVIDAKPARLHRRRRDYVLAGLMQRDDARPRERLLAVLREGTKVTLQGTAALLGLTEQESSQLIEEIAQAGVLVRLPGGIVHRDVAEHILASLQESFGKVHRQNRFQQWVPQSTVISSLGNTVTSLSARDIDWFLNEGCHRGLWTLRGSLAQGAGWQVVLTPEEQKILDEMLIVLKNAGYAVPSEQELYSRFPKRDRVAKALFQYARDRGLVVEVEQAVYWHRDVVDAAVQQLMELAGQTGSFTAAMVRDKLNTSRKHAVTLLEYLDKIGVTKRTGDVRVLVPVTNS